MPMAPTTPRMKKRTSSPVRNAALAAGYRSGLEKVIGEQIAAAGVACEYESEVIRYEHPARTARYTPDFPLPNGIIIETKGRFIPGDRKKHLLVKAQHPNKDIRFVFGNSRARLSKTSKTTYADWCNKHGFLYADKWIPAAWLKEVKKTP